MWVMEQNPEIRGGGMRQGRSREREPHPAGPGNGILQGSGSYSGLMAYDKKDPHPWGAENMVALAAGGAGLLGFRTC